MNAHAQADCGKLVMVVEDDPDVREAVLEVLSDQEYDVVGAANGVEALAALRAGNTRPCVILLDLMMPLMDGRTFREVQQKDPGLASIPIIVLTAHADAAEAAQELRAAGFLRKPIKLAAMLNLVRAHCDDE